MAKAQEKKTRELTGRAVLFWLVGFFGLVFAVNAVLVKAATSTFGGVETSSSYKAGLMFKQEVQAAERQDEQHWRVDGKIALKDGEAVLDIAASDAKGTALSGLVAQARLAHPADGRLDHTIPLDRIGTGQFRGQAAAQPGQWELIVELYRGEERVYRSRNRVTLR